MFTTLTDKEKLDWLSGGSNKQPYKMVGHSFRSIAGKQYCSRCGLFSLNNAASQWCVDKGCNYPDHPQYESKMKKVAGIKL